MVGLKSKLLMEKKEKSNWALQTKVIMYLGKLWNLELFLEGSKLKELKITKRQKLRGSTVFLKPGDCVHQLGLEEDGWIRAKAKNGEEGEIPVTCIDKGNNHL